MNKAEHERSKEYLAASTQGTWSVRATASADADQALLVRGDPFLASTQLPTADAMFCAHAHNVALPAYQQALEEAVDMLQKCAECGYVPHPVLDFLKRWEMES